MPNIPWDEKRCIFCLEKEPFESQAPHIALTEEHIIPESLGGTLSCNFLCHECNTRKLGARIEANAKEDVWVKLAANSAAQNAPNFARRFFEGQKFDVVGNGPDATATFKKGLFRTDARKLSDGSIQMDTGEAVVQLPRMLRAEGVGACAIEAALKRFEDAPNDEVIRLSPGISVAKWSIERIRPSFSGGALDNLVFLKIAYEFLALHMGSVIYHPGMHPIREALEGGRADCFEIEQGYVEPYSEWHGLVLESSRPCTVRIRLFGGMHIRVTLPRIEWGGPRFQYDQNLETGDFGLHQIDSGNQRDDGSAKQI